MLGVLGASTLQGASQTKARAEAMGNGRFKLRQKIGADGSGFDDNAGVWH